MSPAEKEALRQQMLLRALLGDARPGVVAGWLRDGPRFERGLAAYRANAGAVAERALALAYPTLQQLLGEVSFAALARAFWHRQPPRGGDMGLWGDALPAFIADAQSLATEPYLPDVARLEWALHLAERATDAQPVRGLQRLADRAPETLALDFAPGTCLIESSHPVVTLWAAHRSAGPDRFAPVRAAFAAGVAETALVVRHGHQARAHALSQPEAAFTRALLAGQALAAALEAAAAAAAEAAAADAGADADAEAVADAGAKAGAKARAEAGPPFDFETWLITALREQRLVAVRSLTEQETNP